MRVWVPGCATGEEAYSLAILLSEQLNGMVDPPKVQVFSTEIDEPAIATARAGRYPATLLQGLSAERRDRFFVRDENSYVVTKEKRDLCTFSAHSLVRVCCYLAGFNSQSQIQIAVDTTTGAERPLGERKAAMTDEAAD